jgi:pimeloyl-ACP methyl ester carboxylesterase
MWYDLGPPAYAAVPNGRLAVWERGSGLPVVFAHGGTGTAAHDWGHLVEPLSDVARSVLVDLRGHGRSPDEELRLSVTRFGLDLAHVMRWLGIPSAVLVGFSAGANSVLELAARRPELACGVVTIGASARGDAGRVLEIMNGPWPMELRILEHAGGTDNPEYWKELRAALALDWAENVAFPPELLARISCPVWVCHGAADPIVLPEQAGLLAAMVPHAEVVMVPGAGHQVHREAPRDFMHVLRQVVATCTPRTAHG